MPVMMVHIYNPRLDRVETGGLRVQGQPGLHSQKKNFVVDIWTRSGAFRVVWL
jgi:hypothetical protein